MVFVSQLRMQVMGKAVEFVRQGFVAAHQGVVRQYRRNGDKQTRRSGNQSLTNRACHGGNAHLARIGNVHQSMVNAPYRTEQTDKWRGGTNRSERGQAAFKRAQGFGHGIANVAHHIGIEGDLCRQIAFAAALLKGIFAVY